MMKYEGVSPESEHTPNKKMEDGHTDDQGSCEEKENYSGDSSEPDNKVDIESQEKRCNTSLLTDSFDR